VGHRSCKALSFPFLGCLSAHLGISIRLIPLRKHGARSMWPVAPAATFPLLPEALSVSLDPCRGHKGRGDHTVE
jgi:hypothetical protein